MADRYVIADNPDSLNLVDQLYPYRSMSAYDPELTVAAIQKMKRAPITKIAIVSKDNKQALDLIKKEFVELGNWQPDSGTDFAHAIFLSDKTYLIILNNVTGNTANKLEALTLQ